MLVTISGLTRTLVMFVAVWSLASPTPGWAQAYSPPRTPDGQPVLSGFWNPQGASLSSLEEGLNEFDRKLLGGAVSGYGFREARPRPQAPYKSPIIDPPSGKIPYQPWALKKRDEIYSHFLDPKGRLEYVDPVARCLPAGVPRMNYMSIGSFQFLQPPGYVLILSEWNHLYRVIPLDGRPHVGSDIRLWMGSSRGHWEGNTLVVDVRNLTGQTWFDASGRFHGQEMHVVERFTIVDQDTLGYEATIEDPNVFTQPWKLAFKFNRIKEDGYELMEYACQEGNRSLPLILKR
jgi:hypothetical protein